jgi:hypothetical protein
MADAILSSAVQDGAVFVWALDLLMWHLMPWVVNIENVALHSTKRGISYSSYSNMMRWRWKMFAQILMPLLSVFSQPLGDISVWIRDVQRFKASLHCLSNKIHDSITELCIPSCYHGRLGTLKISRVSPVSPILTSIVQGRTVELMLYMSWPAPAIQIDCMSWRVING